MSDAPVVAPAAGGCSVCAHRLADHDVISRRFCTVTLDRALSRACVCSPPAVTT